MAALEKMILALESYLALRAPTAPVFETAADSGPTSAGSSPQATTRSDNGRGSSARRRNQDRTTSGEPAAAAAEAAPLVSGRTIMSAHSGRLHHALKHIREQWDIAQETWDDPVSRDFERCTSSRSNN